MWLKLFVHPTSTMRSLANPPTPFSSFSPCVHCTPVHSAYPHSPVGRAGLLHQGSVSGPQSREGSALQQCWPGAHGCPVVCGVCSSAPEPCAAERAGLGLHGKVVDSVKKSLVAHESVNVYLRQVRRCVCSCNLKSIILYTPQLTGRVGLFHLCHLFPELPDGLLLLLDHLRVPVTDTHCSNVMQVRTSALLQGRVLSGDIIIFKLLQ